MADRSMRINMKQSPGLTDFINSGKRTKKKTANQKASNNRRMDELNRLTVEEVLSIKKLTYVP